ncbi:MULTISPECIES: hypothetical protein [Xanthobacter]|uniref:Uncharacterized protein n=1 Tax=Xanthobacter flavus TaxID=281 RepID=A0A9W6CVR3_XANFL|nr:MULTISPECIES: hypothetical protein [Xanthobacter]MDR6335566.1 hypothetical protein [Xanthobacter flavus]UDQ87823.1 hypothetical protein LJE71_16165 [Xanthobacter autotrophicus]UJX44073.1 hypothetical protein D7006_04530 [Xanthobacter sp. YC-JY1]GLI24758.1 hypothetical protein XFLAVUS301_44320 [Xanthobacter flavus]
MIFRRLVPALLAVTLSATPLLAHEPGTGANGGVRVDAGHYHAELVADGTPAVALYLSDGSDKPVAAAGFKANAILVVEGKAQRFPLSPAGGNRLAGTAAVAIPKGVKGAVQITAPDGSSAQAKY